MAYKNEKIKFGKTAYIAFACVIVAIVIAILLLIPSDNEKMASRFNYVKTDEQTQEKTTVALEKDNVYDIISFRKFQSLTDKKKTFYVFYGNEKIELAVDAAIVFNDLAEEEDINKIYFLDSNKLKKTQKQKVQKMLREFDDSVKKVENLPSFDLWKFENKEMKNNISHYLNEVSNTATAEQIAMWHIFR